MSEPMPRLLVKLSPLEPYFFGGERTFSYAGIGRLSSGGYFIRSLRVPSQTTLFGVLRYLGMRSPEERAARVGKDSYKLIGHTPDPSYGLIRNISPLFLLEDNKYFYARTPLDHTNKEVYKCYTPWTAFCEDHSMTDAGGRNFPTKGAYDEKEGLSDSWVCLNLPCNEHDAPSCDTSCFNGLRIAVHLFQSVIRTGVAKQSDVDGLFRQEFFMLQKGLSGKELAFAFFTEVAEEFSFEPRIVYLGQDKSAFHAEIIPTKQTMESITEPLRRALRPNIAYALSDCFINDCGQADALQKLYRACELVVVESREFRSLLTNYDATTQSYRFIRSEGLTRLIRAGSVFRVRDAQTFDLVMNNPHACIAGFNVILKGDEPQ